MNNTSSEKLSFWEKLKGLEFPHPLVILFAFVLLAALATYFIPGGAYERVNIDGRMVVKAGTFKTIPHKPQGLMDILLVPFNGMTEAADIIFLILIIGGAFGIIRGTGALTAGIFRATQALKGYDLLIIPLLMIVFGLAGGVFGMYEEVIPFVSVIVPMMVAMGYDSIVGISIVYLSTVLGFCGAFLNPYTIGIAQGIAGLPLFSGMGYRIIIWCITVSSGIIYTLIYARKIKKDPTKSLVYESDKEIRKNYSTNDINNPEFIMTKKRAIILIILLFGFVILLFGVIKYEWGIKEITALFFGLGVAAWIIDGKKKLNQSTENFVEGAKELMNAALLIGIARGIKIMLDNGLVMDTILYDLCSVISYFPKLIAVQIMFFIQCILSCILQSGSAQAAVSMPIMTPLADLLGITRQTAVLAFQKGDGFSNFAIPWCGTTLAVLQLGKVPIWKWFKWALWLQVIMVIISMLVLIWPTLTNWGPF